MNSGVVLEPELVELEAGKTLFSSTASMSARKPSVEMAQSERCSSAGARPSGV